MEPVYLDYASGSLSPGARLLVDTHLAMRPGRQAEVAVWDEVGAALLEEAPAAVADGAWARVERMLNDAAACSPPAAAAAGELPEPLASAVGRPLGSLEWTSPIPGMLEWSLPQYPQAQLLRLKPGGGVFQHGHTGRELTLILRGAYRDEEGLWEAGDIEFADGDLWHAPKVVGDEECLCLIVAEGAYRLKGLNRFLARFTGFRDRLA